MEEFGVHERLDESVATRPAELRLTRCHLREKLTIAVDESQDLIRNEVLFNVSCQTDALECAHGLIVQSHTARVVDEDVSLLRDENLQPSGSQNVRQGEPHGPSSHDEHIDGSRLRSRSFSTVGHGHSLASVCCIYRTPSFYIHTYYVECGAIVSTPPSRPKCI